MSGETEAEKSGWTTDTLKYYIDTRLTERDKRFDQRFRAQERAAEKAARSLAREFREHLVQYRRELDIAFKGQEKAIEKAEVATEKRFASVNEFRQQLNDQARTLLSRAEAEARFTSLSEKLTDVTARLDRGEGRLVQEDNSRAINYNNLYVVIAFIGIFLTVVTIALHFIR